jgi:membrane-anchored mycosin MYCP
MSWISRTVARALLAAAAGTVVLALPTAARAADEEYVKYYEVTSAYNGEPENLAGVAGRFLGSRSRSPEIYDRNAGRRQPDGKMLTDPDRLRAGWLLVLPWDAVGAGVQYGVLPDAPAKATPKTPAPGKPAPGKPGTGQPAASKPAAGGTAPAVGGATPATGTRPSPNASQLIPPVSAGCAAAAASSAKSDWARLRLAADQAWPQSRGKGQVVAVVDSGVNGNLPQLAGHVVGGTDVVQPGQRGDTDCLGTGTAMAALIVAQQVKGEGPVGAAPDASVLPVRIAVNQPAATPQVQVKAIESAVTGGATVIALGTYVDPGDAKVAKAIADAVAKDVVVVLGAPTPAKKQADPDADIGEGALFVAGVGVDDKWAVDYRKGAVDVTAPGVNVSSLGGTAATGAGPAAGPGAGTVTGSGTHYAVAYTAAEAALVRAAYPELTAAQVTHRIKATADRMGDGEPPHSQYGWGFLNPAEAVTKVLAEEAKAAPPSAEPVVPDSVTPPPAGAPQKSGGSGGKATVLIITTLVMLAAAGFLGYRIWRLLSPHDDADDAGPPPEQEIDLYDPRFRTPTPLLVTAGGGPGPEPSAPGPPPPPPPPGPSLADRGPVDDGGLDHWSQVGGHWSDAPDGPPPGPRLG